MENEQLIEQLKRIATALEDANLMTEEWITLNKQWRKENVEYVARELAERQATCKEQDEIMLALQRELLTGELNNG